jgi:uncharacterized membrane protein
MREPGRGERIFVFAFTTVAMMIIGLWLAWVRDTERWGLLALFFAVMAVVIWKLWDYRPPD